MRALIRAAAAHGKTKLPTAAQGHLVIKSTSAKQKPRQRTAWRRTFRSSHFRTVAAAVCISPRWHASRLVRMHRGLGYDVHKPPDA